MFKLNTVLALSAFSSLAYAAPQSVLGVSYTLPAGWKVEAQPATSKKVTGTIQLEGQEFKFLGSQPPLSARMQVSRLSGGQVPLKDCELNQTFTSPMQKGAADFKTSGDKMVSLPHIKGCITEFSYTSKRGFVMWGRIFSAKDKTHMVALLVTSADQKTAQGKKLHTIRFKEMDTLLNTLSIN